MSTQLTIVQAIILLVDITIVYIYMLVTCSLSHRYYSPRTGLETDHVSALYAHKLRVHSVLRIHVWARVEFHTLEPVRTSQRRAPFTKYQDEGWRSRCLESGESWFLPLLKVSTCTGREQRFGEGLNGIAASRQRFVVKSTPLPCFFTNFVGLQRRRYTLQ